MFLSGLCFPFFAVSVMVGLLCFIPYPVRLGTRLRRCCSVEVIGVASVIVCVIGDADVCVLVVAPPGMFAHLS